MREWTPELVAVAAGADLIAPGSAHGGPARACADSRELRPGDLFIGLPGTRVHGGRFAGAALEAGAWGVLSEPAYVEALTPGTGARLAASDPLAALQQLARAWRRELRAQVVGITGSTGKTSTKELLRALLEPHRRVVASRANRNTEVGLPLEVLGAPAGTEVLVLEMAMRGTGQISELARIAEPDVGVIVSVGPVHLELLGSLEAIAAAKAELISSLAPGATAIVPAGEPLLEPHLRRDMRTIRFGEGGDIRFASIDGRRVTIAVDGERTGIESTALELELSFTQAHLRYDLLAAAAAALAVGVRPQGTVELELGAGRGRRVELELAPRRPSEPARRLTLIDDCYNANPMSMRAALEDLAAIPAARRVAVLGDMLELGPGAERYHLQLGEQATRAGVGVLIAVGPLAAAAGERFEGELHCAADAAQAAELVPRLVRAGDVVLVKGSRAVGLEQVCEALLARGSIESRKPPGGPTASREERVA
jgi:UDP-N-acetylmuramoyl-tripeptide--D-alanyl-D-alanine ligase